VISQHFWRIRLRIESRRVANSAWPSLMRWAVPGLGSTLADKGRVSRGSDHRRPRRRPGLALIHGGDQGSCRRHRRARAGSRSHETNHNSAVVPIEVEGTPRDLHPILRDEVYRIAGEALAEGIHPQPGGGPCVASDRPRERQQEMCVKMRSPFPCKSYTLH
jgi:hypothetical protein